jgi:hypothetical protein
MSRRVAVQAADARSRAHEVGGHTAVPAVPTMMAPKTSFVSDVAAAAKAMTDAESLERQ